MLFVSVPVIRSFKNFRLQICGDVQDYSSDTLAYYREGCVFKVSHRALRLTINGHEIIHLDGKCS